MTLIEESSIGEESKRHRKIIINRSDLCRNFRQYVLGNQDATYVRSIVFDGNELIFRLLTPDDLHL